VMNATSPGLERRESNSPPAGVSTQWQ